MEPLTRQQSSPGIGSVLAKDLFRGLMIGAVVYLSWVFLHSILFGVLG